MVFVKIICKTKRVLRSSLVKLLFGYSECTEHIPVREIVLVITTRKETECRVRDGYITFPSSQIARELRLPATTERTVAELREVTEETHSFSSLSPSPSCPSSPEPLKNKNRR